MSGPILVTGGCGFIGSAFIRRLTGKGHPVVNVDALTYAGDMKRLETTGELCETVVLDVTDPSFEAVVCEARPHAIVHFAAQTHVTRGEREPERFFRTNVEGTRAVMEAALRAGVEHVIHVSTDEVYGPCHGTAFREEDKAPGEGLATSAYARSKALADDLAASYMSRLPLTIVRPTNCFGPWQHPEKAIARWSIRAVQGLDIPVWGDGKQVRDWLYVSDACDALALLLEAQAGSTFNLAPEGRQRSNLEIAESVARCVGDADLVYRTTYDRPQHDRRYAVDASRVRSLGWVPTAPLEERLCETVSWYREHQDWWAPLVADAEALYSDSQRKE